MDKNNVIKIANTTNLPALNIKSQLNMNIDSNSPIKQVVSIEACLIESQVDSMSGKAIVKGVIGVKVIYMDYDNMFNTLSDTINFTETLSSDKLNNDCQVTVTSSQFVADFYNDEKYLKLILSFMIAAQIIFAFSSYFHKGERISWNMFSEEYYEQWEQNRKEMEQKFVDRQLQLAENLEQRFDQMKGIEVESEMENVKEIGIEKIVIQK